MWCPCAVGTEKGLRGWACGLTAEGQQAGVGDGRLAQVQHLEHREVIKGRIYNFRILECIAQLSNDTFSSLGKRLYCIDREA